MLFHLPNFLEFLPAKVASCLGIVINSLLAIVNVLDMRDDVVAVEELLPANFTSVVALPGVALKREFEF